MPIKLDISSLRDEDRELTGGHLRSHDGVKSGISAGGPFVVGREGIRERGGGLLADLPYNNQYLYCYCKTDKARESPVSLGNKARVSF